MVGVGCRVYDRCVLRRLRIENLVLIREAELELAPGLNAITGETGAGKTILAQALGLLLGAKGDDSYVGAAGDEAYVEAELDLPEELEEEDALRAERERHRHVAELASGAAAAAAALAPDEGEGATGLVALAERSVAPLEQLAPELQRAGNELRDVELRLRETASDLHSFLASLEAEPERLEQLEAELDRIAETKRRFRCATYDELLARRAEAEAELAALEGGSDPAEVAARELAAAEERVHALALELRAERNAAGPAFADAVAAELRGVGMGDGEFVCELRERDEPGATGADEAVFLVRPNAGLPFAPVAEPASGA